MWHKIQDVLEERVKAGVEVRVFYDDMGSIGFINTDFVKKMALEGKHLFGGIYIFFQQCDAFQQTFYRI